MVEPVCKRSVVRHWLPALAALAVSCGLPAHAQPADATILEAREALRKKDKARLAALRSAAAGHALAPWVDYWELTNRLPEAQHSELEAFYARWSGSYVEDRLRNDWLLELGKRRDWDNFSRDYPRFRMNDDREVSCYALLTQHLAGQDVRDAARAAWFAQRDSDDGCSLLAGTLFGARQLEVADIWQKARLAVEANRPSAAVAAATLLGDEAAAAAREALNQPERWLEQTAKRPGTTPTRQQVATLALMRIAANEPEAAALRLDKDWARALTPEMSAAAWGAIGRQAALKLMPEAVSYYQQAFAAQRRSSQPPAWSDDTLAWAVRAALRSARPGEERWAMVADAVDAMSPGGQRDPAWVYWKARALQARARPGSEGDAQRLAAQQMLATIAGPFDFYAKLALEDLGRPLALPPTPQPLSAAERDSARATPGLARALQLIGLGLRSEGVREWNFTLRGMTDRELLAAAHWACAQEVWDRCINTSDRTRVEFDLAQRFPTPFRDDVVKAARAIGLDPAYVYGLIRQESRFVMDARSHVGASGLMQLMPATARWTARRIGLDYRPDMITDRDINLKLGTAYLKLVLEDFAGSAPLAAAAYNAGPNRPRRWREGAVVEAAAWAEGIPFTETRDYVKKVLSNATLYAKLLDPASAPTLKTRLGPDIGPRAAGAPAANRELP
jgi:soluble lytic murein transglycosylase